MLDNMIQISVLMPVFKPNTNWLTTTIESLNQQTFKSWQLIMALDGDDKETIAAIAIAEYKLNHSQRLVVVQGERGGISDALNRGLTACNTPYTARLDADDICQPERLELQWLQLEKEQDLVACGMQIQAIDTKGNRLRKRFHTYPTSRIATLAVGALFNTPIAHPVLMFRTSIAVRIGGYNKKRCMEDYDIMARLSEHGSLINLSSTGLYYRVHGNQHSLEARPKRNQLLQIRWKFMKVWAKEQPITAPLIVIPLAFYLLGPKAEYRLRRLASRIGSAFISMRCGETIANNPDDANKEGL